MNRFEYLSQSESRKGTFSQDSRFDHGSIYDEKGKRTGIKIGPGTYNDEEVITKLKKKPCMSTFLKPIIGPNDSVFEMQGHSRVLCPSYLPKHKKEDFYIMLDKFQYHLGRKVNETLAFHETLPKQHMS